MTCSRHRFRDLKDSTVNESTSKLHTIIHASLGHSTHLPGNTSSQIWTPRSIPVLRLFNLIDKRLGIRLASQEVLPSKTTDGQYEQSQCSGTSQTHLERIHVVPAPTYKQNLVAVPFSKRGIEWGLLEHRGVHVLCEHERIGIPTPGKWSNESKERREKNSPVIPCIVPTDDMPKRPLFGHILDPLDK